MQVETEPDVTEPAELETVETEPAEKEHKVSVKNSHIHGQTE